MVQLTMDSLRDVLSPVDTLHSTSMSYEKSEPQLLLTFGTSPAIFRPLSPGSKNVAKIHDSKTTTLI